MDNYLHEDCLTAQSLFEKRLDEMALTAAETAFLDRHLTACSVCVQSVREMESLLSSFKHFEDVSVPEDLTDRIMARLEPQSVRAHKRSPVAIAAAVALVVVTASVLFLQKPAGEPVEQIASRPNTHPVISEQVVPPVIHTQTGETPVATVTTPSTQTPVQIQVATGHPATIPSTHPAKSHTTRVRVSDDEIDETLVAEALPPDPLLGTTEFPSEDGSRQETLVDLVGF